MMAQELTVKQFAAREQVTTRTVRTWIAKGAVDYRRTPGGSVRIIDRRESVIVVDMKSAEDRGSLGE